MRPGQEEHDRLKAELPAGSCIQDCPFCADTQIASKEDKVSDEKIYDQVTLDALLASARSEAAQEAKTATATELAEVQASLEAKDEALVAANAKIEELEGQIAKTAEDAQLADLAEERASKVAEVTAFTEQQVNERKASWAEMGEEAFAQMLVDFKSVTENAKAVKVDDKKPPVTKFNATRETAGDKGTDLERLKGFLAVSGN